MKLAAVDKVEEGHHDECVENKGEVSWVHPCIFENSLIVVIASNCDHPTTSDGPTNDTVMPFPLRMPSKSWSIVGINEFRYECLPPKD